MMLELNKVVELLRELKATLAYNSTDMGELGSYVKLAYAHKAVDNTLHLVRSVARNGAREPE